MSCKSDIFLIRKEIIDKMAAPNQSAPPASAASAASAASDEKKEEEIRPLTQLLLSIADGTSHRRVNEAFQMMVRSAVLHDKNAPISSISREDMHERMKAASRLVLPNAPAILESLRKGRTMKETEEDPKTRFILLAEIVRYAYSKEIMQACVLPPEFWVERKNDLVSRAQKFGVRLDPDQWRQFLVLVDTKSRKYLAKRKSGKSAEATRTEKAEKAAKRKRDGIQKPMKPEFEIYAKMAALSRLDDIPAMSEFVITMRGILAMASLQIDPEALLKMECTFENSLSCLRAAMLMPKPMFDTFVEQQKETTKRILGAMGTIIVHRPDGVNPAEVDQAVQNFLRDRHDDFQSMIRKWNPSAAEPAQGK